MAVKRHLLQQAQQFRLWEILTRMKAEIDTAKLTVSQIHANVSPQLDFPVTHANVERALKSAGIAIRRPHGINNDPSASARILAAVAQARAEAAEAHQKVLAQLAALHSRVEAIAERADAPAARE